MTPRLFDDNDKSYNTHEVRHTQTRNRPTMQDDEALEAVFETVDPIEVVVIKSLLEGAGILYLTRGEDQHDAFRGAFRGTVFSPRGRPVVFLVPTRMVNEARLLLKEVELPDEGE